MNANWAALAETTRSNDHEPSVPAMIAPGISSVPHLFRIRSEAPGVAVPAKRFSDPAANDSVVTAAGWKASASAWIVKTGRGRGPIALGLLDGESERGGVLGDDPIEAPGAVGVGRDGVGHERRAPFVDDADRCARRGRADEGVADTRAERGRRDGGADEFDVVDRRLRGVDGRGDGRVAVEVELHRLGRFRVEAVRHDVGRDRGRPQRVVLLGPAQVAVGVDFGLAQDVAGAGIAQLHEGPVGGLVGGTGDDRVQVVPVQLAVADGGGGAGVEAVGRLDAGSGQVAVSGEGRGRQGAGEKAEAEAADGDRFQGGVHVISSFREVRREIAQHPGECHIPPECMPVRRDGAGLEALLDGADGSA